ncbi:MAG: ABC transporter ATP-binding protein [Clostridia bacterium]|nr:ABC transporter ATP-binding protein [Clostridia bacterium]
MKKIFKYFSKYKVSCVLAPLFKLIEALLELFIPIIVAKIIDDGVIGGNQSAIITGAIVMVTLGVLGLGFSIAGQYFSAKTAVSYSADLRESVYKKIMGLSLLQTEKLGTAKMITTMTSDVQKVQSGVNLALRLLLRSPFVVLGAFVAALIIDASVALIFGGVIVVLAVVVVVIMKITMPKFSASQKMLDGVSQTARENLTGVRVIRAFGVEEKESSDYSNKINGLEKMQNYAGKISALLNPLTFCVVNLAIIALLYFGGVKVEVGILTCGAVIALYDYMSQILVELIKFANLVVSISKALTSGKRIDEILSIEEEKIIPKQTQENLSFIEFKSVSASYGGGEVLSNINLKIEKGQTVGVIGGTGSGKSTLINLIGGLYTANGGAVYIDGKDVSGLSPSERRKYVSIALQKPVLFKGTVRSNLLTGNQNATEKDMENALGVAQATEIISGKEGGLDSVVEQGGRNFSGGQRQRLSLARAIISHSDVLILDDSSSALDYITDLNLRRAIKNQNENQTVIIVSQRTASVKDVDKIIVLDDGEIVGEGTHETLYKTCEVYREIEDSQKMEDGE